jgi:membrane dipeptidase
MVFFTRVMSENRGRSSPMRLVDLHCDWLRQYATETTLYDGSLYPEIPDRVGRLDGYLLGTSLAVLVCARKPDDWSSQPDAWSALGLMIARYEAEFAGRILHDTADVARWRSSSTDGLCWGVVGVAGFEHLVRETNDLDRLSVLFERGVRVFQPVAARGGELGGSSATGDDRGLTDVGRAFLDRIAELSRGGVAAPRPILDLAGMNAATMADTLRWCDESRSSQASLLVAVSHGTGGYQALLDGSSQDVRNLAGVRSRGGVIGLTPGLPGCGTPDELKRLIQAIADLPFDGHSGYEGIAVGSDLLGLERTAPGFASARDITRRLGQAFDRKTAAAIASGNARRILFRSAGVDPEAEGAEESASTT